MKNYSVLEYKDVSEYFHYTFIDSREAFWYEKAWEILEHSSLTLFHNRQEECQVYIRVIALQIMTEHFFYYAFDESCGEFLNYYDIDDFFSENEIGQLYAFEYNEFSEDVGEQIYKLVDREIPKIYSALLDGFGGKDDLVGIDRIFLGLLLISYDPDCWLQDDDESYSEECIIKTYQQYWNSIETETSDLMWYTEDHPNAFSAHSYVTEGMPREFY